jgi:LacI family transcriptional regulator
VNPQSRRVTLRHVAERAGVSAPTISKVLNGRSDVAPDTRERVLRALREEGYQPRGAVTVPESGQTVELTFDSLENPNSLDLVRGVVAAATQHGGRVAVSTLAADVDPARWVDGLRTLGRTGLVLVTSRLSDAMHRRLDAASLPFVLIDPVYPVDTQVVSIGVGNWQAGLTAVLHLLELGHRRIAMLRGYECLVDDARYHGYVAGLSRFDIPVDPALVARADFQYDGAVDAAGEILCRRDPPTAVFAANDLEALGTIQAARRLGLTVPGDLSVVGFDDTGLARMSSPPLTTIRQPFAEIGQLAYRLLTDVTEGRNLASARIELSASLIVRESTGPIRRSGH